MRISDWSSDVCSSDLPDDILRRILDITGFAVDAVLRVDLQARVAAGVVAHDFVDARRAIALRRLVVELQVMLDRDRGVLPRPVDRLRSEEHTSELQSLMSISYDVFCLII